MEFFKRGDSEQWHAPLAVECVVACNTPLLLLAACRLIRSLRELRLGGNQITRLPGCVPELRALEVLDLRGNTLESLPDDLKYMRSLLDLDLEGNPIGPEVLRG